MLIDNGALKENQHFVDATGQTPLHIAIAANQVQAAEVLVLKCPAWISAQDGTMGFSMIQRLLVQLRPIDLRHRPELENCLVLIQHVQGI